MSEAFSWSMLFRAIQENFRLFAAVFLSVLVLAFFYARLATRQYEAVALVAPPMASLLATGSTGMSGGAGLVSSLLGGGSSGTEPESFDRFMKLVSSTALAEALLKDDRVKASLYPTQWDAAKREWHAPRSLGGRLSLAVKSLLGFPAWEPPDGRGLATYLGTHVSFTSAARSQVYQMAYRHSDKAFAAYLLRAVSQELDRRLRQDFVTRQRAHLLYIDKVLSQISSAELRAGMAELYVQEQRRLMLASSDQPFSADLIDPVSVGDKPVTPNLPVVFGGAVFLGFCLAVLAVLLLPQHMKRWRGFARKASLPG